MKDEHLPDPCPMDDPFIYPEDEEIEDDDADDEEDSDLDED